MKKRFFSGKQKRDQLWRKYLRELNCKSFRAKNDFCYSALAIGLTSVAAYADVPVGLIGGITDSSGAYSAFISSDGTPSSISSLPSSGQINCVDINLLGIGLIGGQDNTDGYAAFVSPAGVISPLSLNLPMGIISSTSINNGSKGIVGGNDTSFNMYAALVSQNGTVTPLALSLQGFIRSTALNDDGIALIGGEGVTNPYAAYVTAGGVVSQIDTTPLIGGHLIVAINDHGNGIIGGFSTLGAYAAFVTPSGVTPSPLSPIPSGVNSFISSVAINNSGAGLIGGHDDSGNMYAGYSTAAGVVTPLFTSPDPGDILSVALNSSGTGLIGGVNNSNLYAALIQPNGNINPLFSAPNLGSINAVAINNVGIGLIGGQIGSDGYAALVAPSGALTVLDMTDQSTIASVALHDIFLNSVTPQSTGPYSSGYYTQLAASAALGTRFIEQNKLWAKRKTSQAEIAQGELAYNKDTLLVQNSPAVSCVEKLETPEKHNALWITPFGNYVHLKAQGLIPSYTNEVGGILLGYDHQDSNYIIGTSAGYAFNYIDYSRGIGHSKLQEEMVSLYGAYYLDHFWFDVALWGGLYQLSNVRHTLSTITSKSSTHGWIFSPHLEMASPWALDNCERYFIEPFFMLDWVNNWQHGYTEHGAAGLNLKMKNLYGSLLQSEVGLRFYEQFEYRWGDFCLEEKLSYVNQAPFHLNRANTAFVASASTFPIAVGSTKTENLGAVQLTGIFKPQNHSYPFGGVTIQVMGNGSYQSYFASLFAGIDF
jgi:outer membrane autotransporter protein